MDPAIARTRPQRAPTRELVSRVRAIAEPTATPKISTHLKTAPSLYVIAPLPSAARRARNRLEDVDGEEHDDPHDVDEVPVDARDLDPEVILGLLAEVAAEGPDRGEGQQH